MHIEKHLDVINACRFCFMCRHLAPVGNVTFREADTPRGRALILDKVRMNPEHLRNPDYVRAIFRSELSAACRFHCVSHYDEAGLVLAARRDMVEAGVEPENVKALAAELQQQPAPQWDGAAGELVYFVDSRTAETQPGIAAAFRKIMAENGLACRTLTGDTGKALWTLGYAAAARKLALGFRDAVRSSGCRTLVTSCPASLDAWTHDYPAMDAALDDRVRVLHTSEFLLELAERGQWKTPAPAGGPVCCLGSDFLKNFLDRGDVPARLLRKLGFTVERFGTNDEESYAVGEGAVVYDRLEPELVKKMCARVAALCRDPGRLITVAPYTRHALSAYSPRPLPVLSLEELLMERGV
ncbi:MAG: hypothetical protein ABR497_12555 [Kiritimatiellia bacterium]|nr:(Fe-S)-binding protein [Lentisphaerota bacterium]